MYYKKDVANSCGSTRVMTQTAMLEFGENGQLNTCTKYQPLELLEAAEH
jgi:hypothetical protein